jgi:hypothetical protein
LSLQNLNIDRISSGSSVSNDRKVVEEFGMIVDSIKSSFKEDPWFGINMSSFSSILFKCVYDIALTIVTSVDLEELDRKAVELTGKETDWFSVTSQGSEQFYGSIRNMNESKCNRYILTHC